MGDWIGLAVIVGLVACGVIGLLYLTKPYNVSAEEFEKRAKEAPSLLSAGFAGLQKILDPAAKKAVETQEDFSRVVTTRSKPRATKTRLAIRTRAAKLRAARIQKNKESNDAEVYFCNGWRGFQPW